MNHESEFKLTHPETPAPDDEHAPDICSPPPSEQEPAPASQDKSAENVTDAPANFSATTSDLDPSANQSSAHAESGTADATIPAATATLPEESDAEIASVSHQEFQRLDPRWVGLLRLMELASWGLLGIVVIVGGIAVLLSSPALIRAIVVAVWVLYLAAAIFRIVWWPRMLFHHWGYRLSDKVVEIKRGIVWKVNVAIPVSRLQHVDLHRGPLERRRELASLELHTAGTRDATQRIPGLSQETAQRLRDELIDAANRGPRGSERA